MTIVANVLGLALTCAIGFALTFGTARYGASGTVVGLLGLVPLVALQRLASRNGRVKPLGGFAATLGIVAANAVALAAAVAVGVADLGRLDYALLGAAVLSVLWLHAIGRGHFFWGALAAVGIAGGGAAFLAAWFQTGLNDLPAAADAWWRSGWQSVAVAGVVCGVVGVVVSRLSRRATGVADLPGPGPQAQRVAARPGLTRAAGPPAVDQAARDARLAVGREGEQRVRELLLNKLPAGTLVLNNLELPGLGGDVDLLVVGDTGLFVPEVKTWSGKISCAADGRSWSRITTSGQHEALPDPAAQTQREIRALRAYLEAADPALCRRTQLWIDGFIVFAHPRVSVDADASPVPALVPEAAVARMRNALPRRPLTPSDQERIVALLEKVQPLALVREMGANGDSVTRH
ncbi:MAG TPA: nuclease-related domain-containing protein [Chloroflexota bacterium]|nr:nuclease-related domain-containing protein [Chloroflexota bacterium]